MLDLLPEPALVRPYQGLPRMPAVFRDLSLIVPKERAWLEVEACVRNACGAVLEDIVLFDAFSGKGVPEGFTSLAFRLTLRAADKTLTDDEVNEKIQKIIGAVEKGLGAQLRPSSGN